MKVKIRMVADIPADTEELIPDVIEQIRAIATTMFGIKVGMNSPIIVSIERVSESAEQEGMVKP